MSIIVNTTAQAEYLSNLDRVSRQLQNELETVARDTQNYMDAIARGEYCHFTPNSSNVEALAAKRNVLIELASALNLEAEWLQVALTGKSAFYEVA
ncbi:hypothetical protein [Corynebacterium striatum]|nr:hypothetical protein U2A4042170029 [Corynebacterium striatum]